MAPITSNSIFSFVVILLNLIAAIGIITWLWYEGKKAVRKIDIEADQYEKLYIQIDKQVSDSIICENRYWYILKKLDELKAMKYKNKEMTSILENSFLTRYKSIRDEINSCEEFDPYRI